MVSARVPTTWATTRAGRHRMRLRSPGEKTSSRHACATPSSTMHTVGGLRLVSMSGA